MLGRCWAALAADPSGMARVRSIATTGVSGGWSSGVYTYDGAGNIVTIGSNWYLYDGLSRLVEATVAGESEVRTYTHDAFGNLTAIAGSGGTRYLRVDPATNRLLGSSYDAAGNQLSWGSGGETYRYAYYPTDQLRRITGGSPAVTRYSGYTADGERIGWYGTDTGGIVYTLRDLEDRPLREVIDRGGRLTWLRDYVWGPAGLLAVVDPDHGTRRVVTDHLGTPRLVCDRCAQRVAYHELWPYGEDAPGSTDDGLRIRFTGHERDLNLPTKTTDDLDYMHARHYSFWTARFLSVDPVEGAVGLAQSWNGYAYVRGNPVNRADPTGRMDNGLLLQVEADRVLVRELGEERARAILAARQRVNAVSADTVR